MQSCGRSFASIAFTSAAYGALTFTAKKIPALGIGLGPVFSLTSALYLGKKLKAEGVSLGFAFVAGTFSGFLGGMETSSSLLFSYIGYRPSKADMILLGSEKYIWIGSITGALVGAGAVVYSYVNSPGPQIQAIHTQAQIAHTQIQTVHVQHNNSLRFRSAAQSGA